MTLPEAERKVDKKEKPFTKVIVRRLPPLMDQATFLQQVSPVPDYNCIYTVRGDSSLGEFAFSRVYINFCHPEDVYSFKERFDNYVFLDNRGHEYPAVVEFAPFQKIPKKRGKARTDPKCGTIESDPAYTQFIESLNKPKEQDEKPEYSLQLTTDKKNETNVTTPLLEFIKNKRAQRMKIREIRREERKRKEFDKRRERFDERKKHSDEHFSNRRDKSADVDEKVEGNEYYKEDKSEKDKDSDKYYYRGKDRRYQENRKYDDKQKEIKPRYPKKEYLENKEIKDKDFRSKFGYKKDEVKPFPKKVKKYSEKREERKMVAQKAEQDKSGQSKKNDPKEASEAIEEKPRKLSETESKNEPNTTPENDVALEKSVTTESPQKEKEKELPKEKPVTDIDSKESEQKDTVKEMDSAESHSQRRIRNKDRPTIAIYRPGMLSKRKHETDTSDKSSSKNESKSECSKN
nr:unnamed protein product [Callosobruchus chinensis]